MDPRSQHQHTYGMQYYTYVSSVPHCYKPMVRAMPLYRPVQVQYGYQHSSSHRSILQHQWDTVFLHVIPIDLRSEVPDPRSVWLSGSVDVCMTMGS